jgi:hypothetical protein
MQWSHEAGNEIMIEVTLAELGTMRVRRLAIYAQPTADDRLVSLYLAPRAGWPTDLCVATADDFLAEAGWSADDLDDEGQPAVCVLWISASAEAARARQQAREEAP